MALIEDNTGNWRVGVLFSQTGVTSVIELTQLDATLCTVSKPSEWIGPPQLGGRAQ